MRLQLDNEHKQPSHVISAARSVRPPRISSQALLGSCGELVVQHGGREYRLRLTRNGKLILTA
ncbi:MAG: hemin uptake protein HemP [Betaproteobacteria bacterium]|nr:hemin uptake protein HemP [Betaproteobacteria bacterium]